MFGCVVLAEFSFYVETPLQMYLCDSIVYMVLGGGGLRSLCSVMIAS